MSETEKKDKVTPVVKRKFSREVAEEQIETFLNYYRLNKEYFEPVDNADNAMQVALNILIEAVMEGALAVEVTDGKLIVTQSLTRPVLNTDEIIYHDKIGKANRAMDTVNPKKQTQRQDAFMSALSNAPESVFVMLEGFDRTLYGRITTVFSMV